MVFIQQKCIDNNVLLQVLISNILSLTRTLQVSHAFSQKLEKVKNIPETYLFCELYSFHLMK